MLESSKHFVSQFGQFLNRGLGLEMMMHSYNRSTKSGGVCNLMEAVIQARRTVTYASSSSEMGSLLLPKLLLYGIDNGCELKLESNAMTTITMLS